MIEIRIHGRGGQGAITTGQIIAKAAFYEGKEVQTFPVFGVERAGAPMMVFVRIDEKPINIRSQVYNPSIVLVLDPTLAGASSIAEGVKKNALFIINSSKDAKEFSWLKDYDVKTIDAMEPAMRIFKKPIVNTPILGAFAKITKLVSIKSLEKAVDEKFLETKGKEIADLNKKVIKMVCDYTKC
jgi:pyruvate ferredoxin oxidoreductase gamma subunit